MRFVVEFKSNSKENPSPRKSMVVAVPSDEMAQQWADKQKLQWNRTDLQTEVGMVEDDLDEYIRHRESISSDFMDLVKAAEDRRRKEREAQQQEAESV